MPWFLCSLLFLFSYLTHADTMDHYMEVSNQIPQMEMKADPQAQGWARSARSVLIITNESIAETLLQANELARTQGKDLFCLPPGVLLNAGTLNELILKTYRDISSQQRDKDKMTVSQLAWLGVTKSYPCGKQPPQQSQQQAFNLNPTTSNQSMQHVNTLLK